MKLLQKLSSLSVFAWKWQVFSVVVANWEAGEAFCNKLWMFCDKGVFWSPLGGPCLCVVICIGLVLDNKLCCNFHRSGSAKCSENVRGSFVYPALNIQL